MFKHPSVLVFWPFFHDQITADKISKAHLLSAPSGAQKSAAKKASRSRVTLSEKSILDKKKRIHG